MPRQYARNEEERRSCTGKTPMPQKAAAMAAARLRRKGHAVEHYRCRFCGNGAWHIGHVKGSWTRPGGRREGEDDEF